MSRKTIDLLESALNLNFIVEIENAKVQVLCWIWFSFGFVKMMKRKLGWL